MICDNKKCKWNKGGKCRLFPGAKVLECKYRFLNIEKEKGQKK